MPQNNGGPAFPTRQFTVTELQQGVDESERGMTLLNYFAGEMVTALWTIDEQNILYPGNFECCERRARVAYDQADAMLAEKRRREETE